MISRHGRRKHAIKDRTQGRARVKNLPHQSPYGASYITSWRAHASCFGHRLAHAFGPRSRSDGGAIGRISTVLGAQSSGRLAANMLKINIRGTTSPSVADQDADAIRFGGWVAMTKGDGGQASHGDWCSRRMK